MLNYLREEYESCSRRIDEFNGRLFSYFNTILVIVGGYMAFLHSTPSLQQFRLFTPYLLFTALGLAGYQYRRTLILQGYRLHLENRINLMVGDAIYNFGNLSKEFLLNWNFFTIFNAVSYFAVVTFIIYYSNEPTFLLGNLIVQGVLFLGFVTAYIFAERIPRRVAKRFETASTEASPPAQ